MLGMSCTYVLCMYVCMSTVHINVDVDVDVITECKYEEKKRSNKVLRLKKKTKRNPTHLVSSLPNVREKIIICCAEAGYRFAG